jgi:hypothetical protein
VGYPGAVSDSVLPRRPLTVGELLDASVELLRRCGWPVILLGLLLAAGQQGVAVVLSALLDGDRYTFGRWVWLAGWLGMEAGIIAVLGAPAAVAAAASLLGEPVDRRRLLAAPGARWGGTLVAATVVGALAAFGVLACGLPWLAVYCFTGLAVPVLVIDRAGVRAGIERPVQLVLRGAGRPAGVRLLAYLTWLAVRLPVGLVGDSLLAASGAGGSLGTLLAALPWVAVDAVAYPALACLDACLHVENRMRAEGLDIALGRTTPGTARRTLESAP